MLIKLRYFLKSIISLDYKLDFCFVLITTILFVIGFLVPSDKNLDILSFKDKWLNKTYKKNLTNDTQFNKLQKKEYHLPNSKINSNDFIIEWSKKILSKVEKNEPIPREYFSHIPHNLTEIDALNKKNIFISILLPIALRGNEIILEEKQSIKKISTSKKNIDELEFFAKKYKVQNYKNINFANLNNSQISQIKSQLLIKVDTIPISMILAQAIVESGWGSSRFAREGNALFGEWTWQKGMGIKPEENLDANFAVKSFSDISSSLNSYLLNLNRHSAYKALRNYRFENFKDEKPINGLEAANFLSGYAEIGYKYVTKIREMIEANKLYRYDNLVLE